jgi:hypothetical protein
MTEKSARRTLLLWPGIEHNLLRAKERKTIERWVVLDGEDAVTLGLVGPGVWTDEAGGWLHPLTEDGEAVLALAYKTGLLTKDERVESAKTLLGLADSARKTRSADVTVVRASEKREKPLLDAVVESVETNTTTYRVRILLAVEGERGRFWCSCPDHRRHKHVCKHIAAVADRYIEGRTNA